MLRAVLSHRTIGILLGIAAFTTFTAMGYIEAAIPFGIAFALIGLKEIDTTPRKNTVYTFIWFFIACFLSTQVSQCFADTHIGLVIIAHWRNFVAELLMLATFPLLLLAITLKPRLSFAIGVIPFLLLSLANYYIFSFRGNELTPMDFLAIGIAKNVASNYDFGWTFNPTCGPFSYLIILHMGFCLKPAQINKKKLVRIVSAILCIAAAGISIARLPSVYVMSWEKMGSTHNGFLVNFFAQIVTTLKQTPEGYSYEITKKIAERYAAHPTDSAAGTVPASTTSADSTRADSASTDSAAELPSIIVIMDEAYADIGTLNPEFGDTLLYKKLHKNTVKGLALSSVYGGGTANSEYEFLTGNSMAFFNHGISVYQMYIKSPAYSMAAHLKGLGYETIATHPFHRQGWSRDAIWPLLGFETTTFLEDYPQKKKLRDYVSDQEMFEYIIDKFEHKKKPLFLYGVTMQNHSGYLPDENSQKLQVPLERYPGYPDAELYTGLIRESDKALKYLLHYFEQVNEKVVIVFYGDHFPGLNKGFYKEVYGKEFATLKERQKLYKVPFFVWTNYESKSIDVPLTSLNYLSNYVYKVAGIEFPAYNKFLGDMQGQIPAMNSWGFYSTAHHKFLNYNYADGKEKEMLQEYRILQHNSIFDNKRNKVFF